MVNIKNATTETIRDLLGGEVITTEELIQRLFKANVISERHCKIALVRRRYYQLTKDNPSMKYVEAKFICEEEFGVSPTFVDKAIYRYRKVDFEDAF